ncbi:MAG: tRNA adenosine(34) deaminase TadA [Actinomycetota bacterium]
MDQTTDERFMALALDEAHRCLDWDDVPVGCVIARADEVVAAAGNGRQRHHDPTAHAEVLALRDAAAATGTWHLEGCTVYVTLEPCAMCAGAIVLARVDRVVFGTVDPKAGFTGSLGNLVQDERLNHRTELTGGVLADECGHLLRSFFRDRR